MGQVMNMVQWADTRPAEAETDPESGLGDRDSVYPGRRSAADAASLWADMLRPLRGNAVTDSRSRIRKNSGGAGAPEFLRIRLRLEFLYLFIFPFFGESSG